jgi:hypothetical protein
MALDIAQVGQRRNASNSSFDRGPFIVTSS